MVAMFEFIIPGLVSPRQPNIENDPILRHLARSNNLAESSQKPTFGIDFTSSSRSLPLTSCGEQLLLTVTEMPAYSLSERLGAIDTFSDVLRRESGYVI